MIFSGITFLYFFLPITLILHVLLPMRFKNLFLLAASLFFYFSGEPQYLVLLVFFCVLTFYGGRLIEHAAQPLRRTILIVCLLTCFGLLCYFKYTDFILTTLRDGFSLSFQWDVIRLPMGISFYTFQATSYLIDLYRGKHQSAPSFSAFAAYLALFPQLIAGPIVRYESIAPQLSQRTTTFDQWANGIQRFIIGLAKKVLLANVLGSVVQSLNALSAQSVLSLWVIALANVLQLYFDFSGYSDMAIGLGHMLGFHFPENFRYPLIAASIRDFWRRWHISLTTWFKDYVYIPLGGSRVHKWKHCRNLLVVWLLTGLWHGAGWQFIVWGLYFGILLIIETYVLSSWLNHHPRLAHGYTLLLVLLGFVFFHSPSLRDALFQLCAMFGLQGLALYDDASLFYVNNALWLFMLSLVFATPLGTLLEKRIINNTALVDIYGWFKILTLLSLFVLCTAYILNASFQPFLYFRF